MRVEGMIDGGRGGENKGMSTKTTPQETFDYDVFLLSCDSSAANFCSSCTFILFFCYFLVKLKCQNRGRMFLMFFQGFIPLFKIEMMMCVFFFLFWVCSTR